MSRAGDLRRGVVHLGPVTIYVGEARGKVLADAFLLGVEAGRLPEPPPEPKRRHLRIVS